MFKLTVNHVSRVLTAVSESLKNEPKLFQKLRICLACDVQSIWSTQVWSCQKGHQRMVLNLLSFEGKFDSKYEVKFLIYLGYS